MAALIRLHLGRRGAKAGLEPSTPPTSPARPTRRVPPPAAEHFLSPKVLPAKRKRGNAKEEDILAVAPPAGMDTPAAKNVPAAKIITAAKPPPAVKSLSKTPTRGQGQAAAQPPPTPTPGSMMYANGGLLAGTGWRLAEGAEERQPVKTLQVGHEDKSWQY